MSGNIFHECGPLATAREMQNPFKSGLPMFATAHARCGKSLPPADIDVAADTALCRHCGCAFSFSELIGTAAVELDLTNPPDGVSFQRTPGAFVASATTRSWMAWV